MDQNTFHSGGAEAEINTQIAKYRKELVKKYGDSFLASIWITILISRGKNQLKHQNLHEVSKHY